MRQVRRVVIRAVEQQRMDVSSSTPQMVTLSTTCSHTPTHYHIVCESVDKLEVQTPIK